MENILGKLVTKARLRRGVDPVIMDDKRRGEYMERHMSWLCLRLGEKYHVVRTRQFVVADCLSTAII